MKQQNRELLKAQERQAMRGINDVFVMNGRHKVKTSFGLKIFDSLAQIRREKLTEVKKKNLEFSNGIAYKYEMFSQFSKTSPKIIKRNKENGRIHYNRNIKMNFEKEFLEKINHAFIQGGTIEKREYLKSKKSGLIAKMGDSSDDDFDMFNIDDKKEENEEFGNFEVNKGKGRLAQVDEMRNAVKTDMEAQEKEKTGMVNEMSKFKLNLLSGREFESKQEEHYMECFPQYEEVDYQASVKDGLGKKEVDFDSRINGQILKRLKTGK